MTWHSIVWTVWISKTAPKNKAEPSEVSTGWITPIFHKSMKMQRKKMKTDCHCKYLRHTEVELKSLMSRDVYEDISSFCIQNDMAHICKSVIQKHIQAIETGWNPNFLTIRLALRCKENRQAGPKATILSSGPSLSKTSSLDQGCIWMYEFERDYYILGFEERIAVFWGAHIPDPTTAAYDLQTAEYSLQRLNGTRSFVVQNCIHLIAMKKYKELEVSH